MDLKGKRVTVVGIGKSGASSVRLLLRERADVSVTDRRTEAELSKERHDLPRREVRWFLGDTPDEAFREADLIVLSPGVPRSNEPLLRAARRGVPIWSEVELASRFVCAPIVAITGSNGKSTTTALIGEMFQAAGRRTFVGGNFGVPLTEAALADEAWGELVVEVSSFQLETVESLHPVVAVLLNVTPDHLDRYPNVDAYAAAKRRIFAHQGPEDAAVLNADDPVCAQTAVSARRVWFSRRTNPEGDAVWVQSGAIVYRLGNRAGEILPVAELQLVGQHNLENALAASAVALIRGVKEDVVAQVLREFRGLEHRMEFVRDVAGMTYINDSKGTNVGAALQSLESCTGPVIWIAGGVAKGADFTALRGAVARRVKKAVLIGEARLQLRAAVAGVTTVVEADDLAEAVRIASESGSAGDVVLLSPACASFDMFRDFADRGRRFKDLVAAL